MYFDPAPTAPPEESTHGGRPDRTAISVAADLDSATPTVTLTFAEHDGEANEPAVCHVYFHPAHEPLLVSADAWLASSVPSEIHRGPFPTSGPYVVALPGPLPTHLVVQTVFEFAE
jgi:hypothetical protein